MFPQVFGIEHCLYLAIFSALSVAGLICAKKYAKSQLSQTLILKGLAVALFVSVLLNRLAKVFDGDEPYWVGLIPDSFCSASSFLLSLTVIFGKKDNCIYHFVWLLALFGGAATMVYPAFLSYNPSFFCLPTISGLLHHSFCVVLVIALFMFKQISVTHKKWYYTLFGFTCYLTLGAFLMGFFGLPDAFHIVEPLIPNTPLTAWVMAPMYAVGYALVLLAFAAAEKYGKHKKSIE